MSRREKHLLELLEQNGTIKNLLDRKTILEYFDDMYFNSLKNSLTELIQFARHLEKKESGLGLKMLNTDFKDIMSPKVFNNIIKAVKYPNAKLVFNIKDDINHHAVCYKLDKLFTYSKVYESRFKD